MLQNITWPSIEASSTWSFPIYSAVVAIRTHCFLSHDWGHDQKGRNNHTRVSRLNAALKDKGAITWFDEEQMTGNILDKMTEGIDSSIVFLACVTKNYLEKVSSKEELRDNCKIELGYAFQQRGNAKIIPIVMESEMLNHKNWPCGAGKAVLGDLLFYNLSSDDDDAFAEGVDNLSNRILSICCT